MYQKQRYMKQSELQKKKDTDLQKMLLEKKEELRKISFNKSGAAKGGGAARNVRKDIARILTEVTARSKSEDTKA